MGRSRGRVAWSLISDERSRMRTFLNRRKGLMKKSKELSKLCGIDVCVICSGPQSSQKIDVETWPPEASRVQEIISEYRSRSNVDREKRKVDLLDFLNSKKKELEGELGRLKRDNANSESPSMDSRLDEFSEESLMSFCYLLDNNQNLFDVDASMKFPVPSHNFRNSIDVVSDEVLPSLPLCVQEPNYSNGFGGISANMEQTNFCSMDGFSSLLPSVQCIGTSSPPQPLLLPEFFSTQTSQMGAFALQMDQANFGFEFSLSSTSM